MSTNLPPDSGIPSTDPGYPQAAQPPAYSEVAQPGAYPAGSPVPAPVATAAKKERNVIGLIALIVSAVGFIFACMPGALIVGWILLPIGFILGLVALFQKGKPKWQGIVAIIASIVGTIVGVVVFLSVVATAFDDAFSDDEVVIGEPATNEEEGAASEEEAPAAELGTRENPLPLGTPFSSQEWTVIVNSVTLAATDQVLAANQFNDAPDAGYEYILVNYTVTYTGKDADGGIPAFVTLEYVTAAGVTVDSLSKIATAPDALDTMSPLYDGASATGNSVAHVPSPPDGVLAIRPGLLEDKVFVAIQ